MTNKPDSPQQSTVLIVDDNRENRLLLSSQLSMEGYQILQASGGIEGLEMARKHLPDIILLDVMMPDMNGFDVCRELKQDTESATHLIPIIMVTALRETQYRIEGIEAGADEFLSRPHVREELLVRVRTLIRLKRARVHLEDERNRFQLLYNISRAISTELDLHKMMATIITETQRAVGATKGNIMLIDDNGQVTHKFLKRAEQDLEISESVTQDVMTKGLGGWLVEHKRGDIIDNINEDERWITLPDDHMETGAAIGLPLISYDQVMGVIILNHPEIGYFTPDHLVLLETIGASISQALKNANLFNEVNEERLKLQAILSQSAEAIFTTDEEQRIALVNQAAELLFHVEAASIIGIPVKDVPQFQILVPLFENANERSGPEEVTLPDGTVLYASISEIKGVGFAVVMQDVTEYKRIEEMRLEAERREKQLVKETFGRYMGPKLVEHVLSHEPGLLSRRERRTAVVMFADLRNWTGGMIMKVEPDEAISQLNEFFTEMMEIAVENEGTVFELTGDEILVGFNAPFDQPHAPYLALKTALTMQHRFSELRLHWYERTGTELGLGIGIDLGNVVMGNVGAESRMSFRMVGEPMNIAHRLVDLAEDGQIVISSVVYKALQEKAPQLVERVHLEAFGPVKLKGVETPQILYRTQIARKPYPPRK